MTIETKFNVGDECWLMDENKPIKSKIVRIYINIFKDSHFVKYELWDKEDGLVDDSEIITTKEELLASL